MAWLVLLKVGGVNDLVARKPGQVVEFLFSDDQAAENRAAVFGPLRQTLLDAGIGFVAGLLAATVVAVGTYLSRGVEAATMPVALVVRTVPLVALAPIITLVFGNGFFTVAVMSGIVVFFPALVTISFGLRSVTQQMHDVVSVYGGSTWDVLRRVAFPTALPSFFAAIRISVPGAVTGALIAEFYTTSRQRREGRQPGPGALPVLAGLVAARRRDRCLDRALPAGPAAGAPHADPLRHGPGPLVTGRPIG